MATDRTQIVREKLTIRHMITINCRGNHHSASGICADCSAILRYAHERIEMCPYNESPKPACGLCRTNCFTEDRYRQFSKIMRYAGPRMMLYHPYLTVAHIRDAIRAHYRKP